MNNQEPIEVFRQFTVEGFHVGNPDLVDSASKDVVDHQFCMAGVDCRP